MKIDGLNCLLTCRANALLNGVCKFGFGDELLSREEGEATTSIFLLILYATQTQPHLHIKSEQIFQNFNLPGSQHSHINCIIGGAPEMANVAPLGDAHTSHCYSYVDK